MPRTIIFNDTQHVTTLLHYLERNQASELSAAIQAASVLHERDCWLSSREQKILNEPSSAATLIRTVLRRIAGHYLEFTFKEMGVKYGGGMDVVNQVRPKPQLTLPPLPKAEQLTAYWAYLQDWQRLLGIFTEAQQFEERRHNLQTNYPEIFGRAEWFDLTPSQHDLLQRPITFELLLEEDLPSCDDLLNQFAVELGELAQLDRNDLNEKATDLICEFPTYVEACDEGDIPVLLEGVYPDMPFHRVKEFAQILERARKDAERYEHQMKGLGSSPQPLGRWVEASGRPRPVTA